MSDPRDTSDASDRPEGNDPAHAAADAAASPPAGEAEAEGLERNAEDEIAALRAEVADLKDRLLRSVAEAENTRKRAERDKQDASRYGVTSFARDVLSVGDNMRRAIASVSEADRTAASDAVRNLIAGIEMTEREFLSVLERHGVKPIDPQGEKFDPNHHQAMYEVEDASQPAGTVVEVVATGYLIGDRLLRPAMVGVSKGGPAGDGHGRAPGQDGEADAQDGTPGSTIDTKA